MADNNNTLAVIEYPKVAAVTGFTTAQINLVRQTMAPTATVVELAWYLYNAKRLGLEPMLDQIYLIKYDRNKPAEIVTGINGYRAQAESSGVYAGSDVASFDYEDVGQPKGAPSKATVTVWKIVAGQRVPFSAEARWEEFYPDAGKEPSLNGAQYRKRPHNQLSIRAESHALRKAFPYQTGRLDSREPAPAEWVEAIQAADAQQSAPSPALTAARAADYSRIHGSDDDGSAFADQPASPAGPARASESSPQDSDARDPDDGDMVSSKKHPLWAAWSAAVAIAEGEDITTAPYTLPIRADVLEASTDTLRELVYAKRAAAPA